MKLMFPYAKLPSDPRFCDIIQTGASRLFGRLRELDVEGLGLPEYSAEYLRPYQRRLVGVMQKCAYLLSLSLADTEKTLERFVFVEYGGGLGILSLLAREIGVGRVIYNDLNPIALHGARILAKHFGLQADAYVRGEVEDVIQFLLQSKQDCNGIASSNVIEHIPDLDAHFRSLARLHASPGRMTAVMATNVNAHNPWIAKRYARRHMMAENGRLDPITGRVVGGHLATRREIIEKCEPTLSASVVESLAYRTRGCTAESIRASIQCYLNFGQLPSSPEHPTNTCAPDTGVWSDRLMDSARITKPLREAGFVVKILPGYYGPAKQAKQLNWQRRVLNLVIRAVGTPGLRIAPFYTIHAHRFNAGS